MSTNFYYSTVSDETHIGKFSFGWKFCFRQRLDLGIETARDWSEYLVSYGCPVLNEYGEKLSLLEFLGKWVHKDGYWLGDAPKELRGSDIVTRYYRFHEYLDSEGYRFKTMDFC